MTKKFIVPVLIGIASSFIIGPIGFITGFKLGTILLSSSFSFTLITGLGIYSQDNENVIKINKIWENKYNSFIYENNISLSDNEEHLIDKKLDLLNATLFNFFLAQRKNKGLNEIDSDMIIEAKLYLKYMNVYSEYKITKQVEIATFKNIYHLVHLNICLLCKNNNENFNKKIIELKNFDFNCNFHLIYNYNSFYQLLDNIKNDITISHKIDSIFSIFNVISAKYPKITSDNLITLVSLIIVKCQIKDLLTEIEFINFFYDESSHNKMGIKEYCFITFYGSIENIMNITI